MGVRRQRVANNRTRKPLQITSGSVTGGQTRRARKIGPKGYNKTLRPSVKVGIGGAAIVGGTAYGVHKYRARDKNPRTAAKPATHSTTKSQNRVKSKRRGF